MTNNVKGTCVPVEYLVLGMLENNAMQSVASAAGYMTGGGTVAAIPALMMITGTVMGGWQIGTVCANDCSPCFSPRISLARRFS